MHLQSCLDVTRDKLLKFMSSARQNSTLKAADDVRMEGKDKHEAEVFCGGMITATEKDLNFMWQQFVNETSPMRRKLYLNAIGCNEDESILMKFIMKIIESEDVENVSNGEWRIILQASYANNPLGLNVILRFLRQHYNDFIGLLLQLDAMSSMNEIFRDIAKRINNNVMSSTLYDLLIIYNIDDNVRREIHTIVDGNIQWLQKHTRDIQEFLNDYHNKKVTPASSEFLTSMLETVSSLIIMFGLAFNWIIQS